jgi:DNA polymerase
MLSIIGLDFETFSDVDLPKCGLDRYVSSPNFRVLLAAVSFYKGGMKQTQLVDFVEDEKAVETLRDLLTQDGRYVAAHNAGFEKAVLDTIGIDIPSARMIDTAVLARAAGYGGSLQAVSTQLLGNSKMEEGFELIKLFCMPSEERVAAGTPWFDEQMIEEHLSQWVLFGQYCKKDASLCLDVARTLFHKVGSLENGYSAITMDMNQTGWHVDLELVEKMDELYKANVEEEIEAFRQRCNAHDLNLASPIQLFAWCRERGIKVTSLDEKSVTSLLKRIDKKFDTTPDTDPKYIGYWEVRELLRTKQAVGGSSLKKLDVIKRMTGEDGRLRHQYLHVGAGATFRTSGRGVQMQNLKRLHGQGDDVREILLAVSQWSNETLAANLRQCFTAADPNGRLIVGDFSSVESRGLAWQAGEQWKLDAYAAGQDLYKVQAGQMFGVPADAVTKEQRQIGKVAELSCGYGAGPGAVRDFAAKMGVDLSEQEATTLVKDWRTANTGIVEYWKKLDDALRLALSGKVAEVTMPYGLLTITPQTAPTTLINQTGLRNLLSLHLGVIDDTRTLSFERVIHGAHPVGRGLHYWKPSERKTGDPWVDKYTDPKTKHQRHYSIYGGKLSGLLTQSLCRELFFKSLTTTHFWVRGVENLKLIGQFHDEIVLEWEPGVISLDDAVEGLHDRMSTTTLTGFPLSAEVNSAYRYIK